MAYTPAQRNWQGVQFEKLRKKVDPKFNDAHDKLSDAYYTYKREGKNTSAIIGRQTVEFHDSKTLEENKEIFDKYHGLIHCLQQVALDAENKKQAKLDQKLYDKYNVKRKKEVRKQFPDKDGKERFEVTMEEEDKTPIQKIQDKIGKLRSEGFELTI